MTPVAKSIVLITSGQPSINPRLVKEADALHSAGYRVTVLYQFWSHWADHFDTGLLDNKAWESIQIGGSPRRNRATYLVTRVLHKVFRTVCRLSGFTMGRAEASLGRCTELLYAAAVKIPADLYIAHNLAALAPAVRAAKSRGVKCGFDAEDFHRNEVADAPSDFDVRIKTFIEQKYFWQLDHFTASSPLIASRYAALFPKLHITVIRNVFPRKECPAYREASVGEPLRLFWFSQTLNENRGIEEIIDALKLIENPTELHLLGYCTEAYRQQIMGYAASAGVDERLICLHAPVSPTELMGVASKFDIGIAAETGIPANREICLTNKLFTYIQSGLLLLASDTSAQSLFLQEYPQTGSIYRRADPRSLAYQISRYLKEPSALQGIRKANYLLGQASMNWETEQVSFLTEISKTLAAS